MNRSLAVWLCGCKAAETLQEARQRCEKSQFVAQIGRDKYGIQRTDSADVCLEEGLDMGPGNAGEGYRVWEEETILAVTRPEKRPLRPEARRSHSGATITASDANKDALDAAHDARV